MYEEDHQNQSEMDDSEFTSVSDYEVKVPDEEVEVEVKPDKQVEREVPESIRNKTPEQLQKMYLDSQEFIKRQQEEVAFARLMAKQISERTPQAKQTEAQPNDEIPDSEFLINPKQAVARAVADHPAVKQAEANNAEQRKLSAQAKFKEFHPDAVAVIADPEFNEFLAANPVKARLLRAADEHADAELAASILTDFKVSRGNKAEVTKTVLNSGRNQDLADAKVTTGRGKSSNKPIFRTLDIRELIRTNPKKYEAMYEEIMDAYADDRVK